MKILKAIVTTFAVLIGGAFAFLMGAVFMTGLDLSIPVNMVFFIGYNGLVLIGVVIAVVQVWTKARNSDSDQ